MKYFKGIITADWHLSQRIPRARVDDNWIDTQSKIVNQVLKNAIKYKSDVFVVGDIFHSNSDLSFEVISIVQKFAKKLSEYNLKMYIICGNHDLLFHSSRNIDKSGVGLLFNSNNIYPVTEYSDDVSGSNFDEETENKRIIFKHILVIEDENKLSEFTEAVTPSDLLSKYDKSKYIFVGDNHHFFIHNDNDRYVINPGCLIRRNSDFKNYKPKIVYVDEENNLIETLEIKDNESFIDDSYILKEKEKEERIENFANKLQETKEVSLDFIANVESAMKQNKFSKELNETIEELLQV